MASYEISWWQITFWIPLWISPHLVLIFECLGALFLSIFPYMKQINCLHRPQKSLFSGFSKSSYGIFGKVYAQWKVLSLASSSPDSTQLPDPVLPLSTTLDMDSQHDPLRHSTRRIKTFGCYGFSLFVALDSVSIPTSLNRPSKMIVGNKPWQKNFSY